MNNRAPDNPTPDNHDFDRIDDRGFAAGRALRQPAPDHGFAKVRSSYRRRRIVPAATLGIISVIAIGGVITILNQRSQPSLGNPTGSTVPIDSTTTTTLAPNPNPNPNPTTTPPQASTVVPSTQAPANTPTNAPANSQATTPAKPAPVASTSTPGQTTSAPPAASILPVVFYDNALVGAWQGGKLGFVDGTSGVPDGLAGAPIQLTSPSGATYNGTAKLCSHGITGSPSIPGGWMYTNGAPIEVSTTNDDTGLAEMNAKLTELGVDPATVGSFGAPLAADGSVDRVLWTPRGAPSADWVATFDSKSGKITTFDGQMGQPIDYELSVPTGEWLDLDGDGNLESGMQQGDRSLIVEWAGLSELWNGSGAACAG